MWMYAVGWLVGILAGSFFVIQSLIIIFFGYAHARKMKNAGVLSLESRVSTTYTLSLILLIILFSLCCWGMGKLDEKLETGYYIGVALIILMGLKGTFSSKTNRAEFLEKNIVHINPEFLVPYVKNLYETETDLKWLEKHIRSMERRLGYSIRLETVDVLILDTMRENPYREVWTVGDDISKEQADKFLDEEDNLIYVIRLYDNGEQKEMTVTKEYFYKSVHELKNIFESAQG